MQLIDFSVEKLHGFLDISIPFFEDLTVIVGVNGSGKTSALTVMTALLNLDFAAVKKVKLNSATLNAISSSGQPIRLAVKCVDDSSTLVELRISEEVFDISAYRPKEEAAYRFYSPKLVDFDVDVSADFMHLYRNSSQFDSFLFSTITPAASEAARSFLAESRLTFVQLDRTIVAITPDGGEAIERPTQSARKKALEPIEEVMRVTKKKFLDYKNATEEIKDQAYRASLRLHFEPISSSMQGKKFDRADFKQKLQDIKARVSKSSLTSDEVELKSFAAEFFDEFEKLFEASGKQKTVKRSGRRTLDEEQLDAILNLKRWQIEKLLTVFEEEAKRTQDAYAPIRRYFSAAERFFRESGKRLFFGKDYELGFTIVETEQSSTPVPRSLKELSSGERQILIILTYLAFVSGKNSVFVIDEPELSLHLVWQSLLISAVKDLRPEGCQVILATHAPEIAGRARDRTVRLGIKNLT